jgi:hypothetical protein
MKNTVQLIAFLGLAAIAIFRRDLFGVISGLAVLIAGSFCIILALRWLFSKNFKKKISEESNGFIKSSNQAYICLGFLSIPIWGLMLVSWLVAHK